MKEEDIDKLNNKLDDFTKAGAVHIDALKKWLISQIDEAVKARDEELIELSKTILVDRMEHEGNTFAPRCPYNNGINAFVNLIKNNEKDN